MDQQLSDARMRIVQLTAEVQSSKQQVQHHEEHEAALQSQVHLLLLSCG
jgi:phage shock protein A